MRISDWSSDVCSSDLIYGQVARTGEAVRFEDAAEALGGYWYDVYAFRVGDPKAPQVAVLLNDITARRRMEAALRRSEERLRALNETLEDRVQQRSHELALAQEALRRSEEHTSDHKTLMRHSYAVFCLHNKPRQLST